VWIFQFTYPEKAGKNQGRRGAILGFVVGMGPDLSIIAGAPEIMEVAVAAVH
jgi:hypothetical protein